MQALSQAQLGKRVSIRLFDYGGGFRDLVGFYSAQDTIENRKGEVITFNPADIFLWREVTDLNTDSSE